MARSCGASLCARVYPARAGTLADLEVPGLRCIMCEVATGYHCDWTLPDGRETREKRTMSEDLFGKFAEIFNQKIPAQYRDAGWQFVAVFAGIAIHQQSLIGVVLAQPEGENILDSPWYFEMDATPEQAAERAIANLIDGYPSESPVPS